MSFLGGPEIMQKDQGQYPGLLMDLYSSLGQKGSKGENQANKYLKQIFHGNAGDVAFLDPLKNKEAVALREADRATPDQAFANSPELASRTKELNKERTQEMYGGLQEQAVNDAMMGLMSQSQQGYATRKGLQAQVGQNMAQNQLDSQQIVNKPGWGGMLMGALMGGAQAASGLGWKPFGTP